MGLLPRTTRMPNPPGARATPGMFCTTRTVSPDTPAMRVTSPEVMVTEVTSFFSRWPTTNDS